MKRSIYLVAACLMAATTALAAGINYNGTSLSLNTDFTRSECGTAKKKVMKEVSGMACSRRTPGYIWEHGDENMDDNRKIVAIEPSGTLMMTVNIVSTGSERDDWEDIATGVYNGTNYIFIGAIGDNNLEYQDSYYIYYLPEPAISSTTVSANVEYIRFGYPDGSAHNTETLMYDNLEQKFYIATKDEGVCRLYSLPFRTDYGTVKQTLTEVCALGNGSVFNTLTGGDISPDGKWMAIKNEEYILMWERQGTESLSQTALRTPVQIAAYEKEKQGESLAWKDSTTFYTTSDQSKDTPIYQYVRSFAGSGTQTDTTSTDTTSTDTVPAAPVPAAIYEIKMSNSYSAFIPNGGTDVYAYYLSGETEPEVESYLLSAGATLSVAGHTLTLCGEADTTVYTLHVEPIEPLTYVDTLLTLDGSETWIKAAYGFDATKKWRFSKTDTDYSREIAGKTHVELFLPACDTVVLYSMDSKERDVRVYANGVQVTDKFKLLKTGSTLIVEQTTGFMLSVVSAQSSGDGGVKAIRLARKPDNTTGIHSTETERTVTRKILLDGKIYIVLGDRMFSICGQQIER